MVDKQDEMIEDDWEEGAKNEIKLLTLSNSKKSQQLTNAIEAPKFTNINETTISLTKFLRAFYSAWSTSDEFEGVIARLIQKNLNLDRLDVFGPFEVLQTKFGGKGLNIKSVELLEASSDNDFAADLEIIFDGVIAIDAKTTLKINIPIV